MDEKTIARFWAKVDRRGPDDCWPWLAARHDKPFDYGAFGFDGQTRLTHRIAFFIANGRWPDPCGCHRCDNPPCCNPAHIFEGSRADNMHDMFRKNRRPSAKGRRLPQAKLTDDAVRQIRVRRAAGEKLATIAADFGVSKQIAGQVALRKAWKHVR